jgi:glycosyltransferase involved in cell wall biosynthesis
VLPALKRFVGLITRPPPDGLDETMAFLEVVDELTDAAESGHLARALRFETMCELFADRLAGTSWLRQKHHGTLLDVVRLAEAFVHILRPLLFDIGPVDLVHLSATGLPSLVALSTNRRRGAPVVLTEHGMYLRERYLDLGRGGLRPAESAVLLRFYHLLVAGTYRRAAVIAPVSEYNRRWQERVGAPPSKVQVIYSAVETASFPLQISEPQRPTVTWLGRIDPIKDLHTLIRSAAVMRDAIPEVSVRLFGAASPAQQGYLASCRQLVEQLGLGGVVRFEGPVTAPGDAFHAGHISALSSVSEGFPYAVIESMACGVPVVGTDVGGVREAIADAGRCVPARDHRGMARACLELLGDRELRRTMGRRARTRVQTMFDLEAMLGAYERIYVANGGLPGRRHADARSVVLDLRRGARRGEVSTPW